MTKQTNEDEKLWPSTRGYFLSILQNKFHAIPSVPPGTWTGKLYFETIHNQVLALRNGVLSVVSDGRPTVFQVLDADNKQIQNKFPTLPQVRLALALFGPPPEQRISILGLTDAPAIRRQPGFPYPSQHFTGSVRSVRLVSWALGRSF